MPPLTGAPAPPAADGGARPGGASVLPPQPLPLPPLPRAPVGDATATPARPQTAVPQAPVAEAAAARPVSLQAAVQQTTPAPAQPAAPSPIPTGGPPPPVATVEMTTIMQTLMRPAGADASLDSPTARQALFTAPQPGAAAEPSTDADIFLPFRPDMPAPQWRDLTWREDRARAALLSEPGDDPMIAEVDLSILGCFRLETRRSNGGFLVLARHSRPQDAAALASLAERLQAEAERFGVRARIRFSHDPKLVPAA